jgi:hypothetical protein
MYRLELRVNETRSHEQRRAINSWSRLLYQQRWGLADPAYYTLLAADAAYPY